MDLKKFATSVLLVISASSFAIVPNDKFYELAENQIKQLMVQLQDVEKSLESNPSNEIILELKSNLNQEIRLIEQRIKLYKKLECSGLIMYSNEVGC